MSEVASAISQHDQIVTIAISALTILLSAIGVMSVWLKKTIIIIYKQDIAAVKKDMVHCQSEVNIRIDDIDKYGQANRKISYDAKDGIAKHVEDFHTTKGN